MLVMPNWRGVLVTPAEARWIVQRSATDLTSRSLREADATSASLQEAIGIYTFPGFWID